jgi:hypothetical protein
VPVEHLGRRLLEDVLTTGDAMSAQTREFIESARLVSLAKPFALDEMRRVLRQVLGEG